MDKLLNPTNNYTVIPNEIFTLPNISASAKFTYIYLRSRPNNWKINISNICNVVGCGRDKAYKIINELKFFELLSYHREIGGGGTYTLHEITTSVFSASDISASDKSAHIVNKERAVNTDKKLNGHIQKNKIETFFADFWQSYPRKQGKKDAHKAFTAAVKTMGVQQAKELTTKMICDVLNRTAVDSCWQKPQFIPLPATYIRGERWEDTIIPVSNDGKSGLPTSRRDMEKIAVKNGLHAVGASPQHLADDHMYRQWLTEKLR